MKKNIYSYDSNFLAVTKILTLMKLITNLNDIEVLAQKIDAVLKVQRETEPESKQLIFGFSFGQENTPQRFKRLNQCLKQSDLPDIMKVIPEVVSFLANDDKEHSERISSTINNEFKSWGKLWLNTWASVIMSPANFPNAAKNIAEIRKYKIEYTRLCQERDKICSKILEEYRLYKEDNEYFLKLSDYDYYTSNYGWIPTSRGGVDSSVRLDELPPLPPK